MDIAIGKKNWVNSVTSCVFPLKRCGVKKKKLVCRAVENKFRCCLLIKPYLAKLQVKQAGRNERWSHARHRQREQKDTQSNSPRKKQDNVTTWRNTSNIPDSLMNSYRRVHRTRGSRGESLCTTRSCGSILLLLQLQVLLFAWSEDFPDREERQVFVNWTPRFILWLLQEATDLGYERTVQWWIFTLRALAGHQRETLCCRSVYFELLLTKGRSWVVSGSWLTSRHSIPSRFTYWFPLSSVLLTWTPPLTVCTTEERTNDTFNTEHL